MNSVMPARVRVNAAIMSESSVLTVNVLPAARAGWHVLIPLIVVVATVLAACVMAAGNLERSAPATTSAAPAWPVSTELVRLPPVYRRVSCVTTESAAVGKAMTGCVSTVASPSKRAAPPQRIAAAEPVSMALPVLTCVTNVALPATRAEAGTSAVPVSVWMGRAHPMPAIPFPVQNPADTTLPASTASASRPLRSAVMMLDAVTGRSVAGAHATRPNAAERTRRAAAPPARPVDRAPVPR